MSRFGIPMGFNEMTVEEVCKKNGVDCNTFLAVVNFICEDYDFKDSDINISLPSLLHYLQQSHEYFLEFFLPGIRRKLLDAINMKDSDVSFLILKLFDEYVGEISQHMEEEESNLFKYVECLIEGKTYVDNHIVTYSEHHDKVGSTLRELKNIIIKYCPKDAYTNLLNAALYDIYRCEEELASHCRIEDHLLVPAIKNYERILLNN